jgi:putative transposase
VVAFLDAHRGEFGVEPVRVTLPSARAQVARSAYFANKVRTPSARAYPEAVIGAALTTLWQHNPDGSAV